MSDVRESTNPSATRQPGGRLGLALLLVAYALFSLGAMVTMVAVPWLVLTTTGSAVKMGMVAAATTVPFVLTSVFGTPAADRLGTQTTVVLTAFGGALSMAVVAAVPDIDFGLLLVMVAISGGLNGVGGRAQHVLLRPMGEAAGMPMIRVTAIYDGLNNTAMLTGAPLGGFLIYLFSAQGAIWVDAAAMATCGLIVAVLIRPPKDSLPDTKEAAKDRYLAALAQGFRHLLADRLLFGMVLLVAFANLFGIANTSVFVPLWVSEVYGAAPAVGIILGAYSVGVVLGNVIFTAVATKVPQYLTFLVCVAVATTPRHLILALTDELAYVIVVTFACGMMAATVRPILGAMLYARVPVQLQNRVFGLVAAVCQAGLSVGGLMAGWLVTGFGLHDAILIAAGGCLVLTLVPLLRYRHRQHADPATEDAEAKDDTKSTDDDETAKEGAAAGSEEPAAEAR